MRKASHFVLVLAALAGCATTPSEGATANGPAGRTVAFPADRSLGIFFIVDPARLSLTEIRPVSTGPAQGEVVVPPGKALLLGFIGGEEDEPLDLSSLDRLSPSALQGFGAAFGEITPRELRRLRRFESLQYLALSGFNGVDDRCMPTIGDLSTLRVLSLPETNVSDEGVAHLKRLENLERLDLYGTQISDAGLQELEGLEHLHFLRLDHTDVSEAGIARLRRSLPSLDVIRPDLYR